ncbi:DUF1294 domain-containing protein [Bacillus carboniphilus]|uniref:DUF1294 domain-containing protein n=1 Tax=Bacillus carboniphilus TaxID=86663 RepID=A0ABP3G233_9BACI
MIYKFIFFYLLIFNIWGYILMAIDKKRAIKQKHRISEKFIWQIAFIGGAIGIYMGMKKFRHKTLHKVFVYGVPAVIVLHALVIIALGIYMKD